MGPSLWGGVRVFQNPILQERVCDYGAAVDKWGGFILFIFISSQLTNDNVNEENAFALVQGFIVFAVWYFVFTVAPRVKDNPAL